ncbi:Fic family protein [Prosthecochloris sp. SCSIO W1102]|uniref:Fic family protein n=1 Tax=Prosthecochloris sp. SCSIO W1102 TaxID=2992243 RepID=UPI00223C9DFE|nr:Fic family protein [Prosthecochloris sp. SCSIO W1102]UZJ39791.1 Fic family protein [Prosthecochloris sp. SCSIO W1102]
MPGKIPTIPEAGITIDSHRSWVGYAALQHVLKCEAPLKGPPCAVSAGHVRGSVRFDKGIRLYDQRYRPDSDVAGHLFFTLKHETLDLLVLKEILVRLGSETVTEIIKSYQQKQLARKLWFLHEWLTAEKLPLDNAKSRIRYVPLLDSRQYFTGPNRPSVRHRIIDNLLGNRSFCPVIRKTEVLHKFIALDISNKVIEVMGKTSRDVWRRAASFLLLADSRASFAIEGERPPRNRIERWAQVIQKSGNRPLSMTEILNMHDALIQDNRFVTKGFRTEGVFLGERDRLGEPQPEFIGARPQDIETLMHGLVDSHHIMTEASIDPVIHAATIAFGLVFIHPFEDGNGRMHRALIHQILTERSFAPPGIVFPVSAIMLERIEEYQRVLRDFTLPLMHGIQWRPTEKGNVEVLNDTADTYRYGDYTAIAEFLYRSVEQTTSELLPQEVHYLTCYDKAQKAIGNRIDMPANQIRDLIMFITQNDMKLSLHRRQKEFSALSDEEVEAIESDVSRAFTMQDE